MQVNDNDLVVLGWAAADQREGHSLNRETQGEVKMISYTIGTLLLVSCIDSIAKSVNSRHILHICTLCFQLSC